MNIDDFIINLNHDGELLEELTLKDKTYNKVSRTEIQNNKKFIQIMYKFITLFGLPRRGDLINFDGDFAFEVDCTTVDFENKIISIYFNE